MKHPSLLKLSAASCSLTPRQAAGNALADGFNAILQRWIVVTLAVVLQTGFLFTAGTEAVA
jgi:hypothetical protein